MTDESKNASWFVPDPAKIRFSTDVNFDRTGVEKTIFFFSFSGGMVVEGELCPVTGQMNGCRFDAAVPTRISEPSRRPTPQLDFGNVQKFFKVDIPPPFPLQLSTFPSLNRHDGASASVWFGPCILPSNDDSRLPKDTLVITYYGPRSQNEGPTIERYILRPFFEWLRVLSRQWWIGRSMEGAGGALHFIAPLNREGAIVGSPTPFLQFTTAGAGMQPITIDIWNEAWERTFRTEIPRADKSLEMDANFAIASNEFRIGIILACSSIEAARDALLARIGARISEMKTSKTDLLKHLSVGLEKIMGVNLEHDRPDLFKIAKTFWCARGEAAHGRPVRWHLDGEDLAIEDVKFGTISDNLAHILNWLDSVSDLACGTEK